MKDILLVHFRNRMNCSGVGRNPNRTKAPWVAEVSNLRTTVLCNVTIIITNFLREV